MFKDSGEKEVSENKESAESRQKIKEAQTDIGAELNGEKPEKRFDPDVKYNKDGDGIKGKPEVRDEKFYKRNEDGEIVTDDKGNKTIDWESHGKHIRDDEKAKKTEGFDDRYEVKDTVLKKGDVIDRYGGENGSFVSPEGESFESRSLPYKEESVEYHKYRVKEEIPCKEGTAAPNFEQQGGARQYKLEKPVDYYLDSGALEEVYDDDDE